MTKDMKPLIEKRKYEKPAMQVYELQRHAPIICTSGGGDGGPMPGYGPDPTNPINPFIP